MEPLISLDLETTGLDPKRDTVIEIGAVKFRGSRIEDTWSTLVNPGRPLHPSIVALTGINDDMLSTAPRLTQVLGGLEDFVGDLPILGHNIGFDLSFLQPKGLFGYNQSLDTLDLASVLLPTAGRYSLAALAGALGIPVRNTHRALDDAHTTCQVFLRLYEKALELPYDLVEMINHLGIEVEWGAGWVFDSIIDHHAQFLTVDAAPSIPLHDYFPPIESLPKPLTSVEAPQPMDVDEIASILEPGGPFAKKFASYEHRSQQITMARAVAEALSNNNHLLVEAGTGTGKSMAYLVPAFAWATLNGERVIISTNTINLQDQLIHKDIPDLCRILNTDYRATVLKGRGNYLCPRRLIGMIQLGARSEEEIRVLAKILVWLHHGGLGDRSEINFLPREGVIWSRVSAEGEECSLETCLEYTGGGCPYYKARLSAESAHIVIVNHALLLADIATGNRVIPEYRYLIVDEAHHLEDATTNGLSFEVNQRDVLQLLRNLGSRNVGLLAQVLEIMRTELLPENFAHVEQAISAISDRTLDCLHLAQRTFDTLSNFMTFRREGEPIGPYGHQFRIVPSTRTLPEWSEVEIAWENLRGPLSTVVEALIEISEGMEELVQSGSQTGENLSIAIGIIARDLSEVFSNLNHMIFEPDPQIIYWLETQIGQERLSLHAAPLEVGPLVERYLWHEKESVVMTSATLTTSGDFDHIRRRLNADDADEIALGSPFDYESSTLLYLIDDIPEPTAVQAYQRSVERGLLALLRETRGRTLVLFTSNEQLRRTAQAISQPLSLDGIHTFEQGAGISRHALLENFRSTDQAVLLCTRSFWEGVDVPGEALSVVVIIRLPFSVPSDPIVAARSETYESPFYEYTVPEAILRFRQGFGRLIRTKSDRGVVAIFDHRILSKNYGGSFISSLPRCTIRQGHLADLPSAAVRWLGI
ncbi:MAG TPA: DEAD/DEAH box helicase family protein [Anaerolineae bacterium]|nr:DEAD/DEAH box helicase family protein [Anaerolineae bacterium]